MQGSKEAERRPGDGQVCCSLTPGHGSGTGEEGEGAERESLLWGDDIDGTFIPLICILTPSASRVTILKDGSLWQSLKLNEVRRGGWPDGVSIFTGRELMLFVKERLSEDMRSRWLS